MKKKQLSILIICLISFTVLFGLYMLFRDSALEKSGECGIDGDNITWKLSESGTLTLSGEGSTQSYKSTENRPWQRFEDSIEKVSIEEGVTVIGSYLFRNCKNLKSVNLPNGLKEIKFLAFQNCESLKEVFIPASLETIGFAVFDSCDSIERFIVDPSNPFFTEDNGNLLSYDKKKLIRASSTATGKFVVPEYVEVINNDAFCNSQISELVINSNVNSIGTYIVDECYNLNTIFVSPSNEKYISIKNSILSKDETELIAVAPKYSEDKYVVPRSVTIVRGGAFTSTNLSSIEFPAGIKLIESEIVQLSTRDITLVFNGNAPEIEILPNDPKYKVTISYPENAEGWGKLKKRSTSDQVIWIPYK